MELIESKPFNVVLTSIVGLGAGFMLFHLVRLIYLVADMKGPLLPGQAVLFALMAATTSVLSIWTFELGNRTVDLFKNKEGE